MFSETSNLASRITDLLALAISYLLYSSLLNYAKDDIYLIVDMFFYVSLVFICLRLSKKLFFVLFIPKSRVLYILMGNISGLVVGTILVLVFVQFFPAFEEKSVVIIASSVQAFFILGTLSPLVKSSHRDIIHKGVNYMTDREKIVDEFAEIVKLMDVSVDTDIGQSAAQ